MSNKYNQRFLKRQFTIRYIRRKKIEDIAANAQRFWEKLVRQDSIEELKENIKDAISLILESIKEEADIQKKKSLIIEV